MPKITSKRRVLAHYGFENGGSVEIACSGDVDTATALETAASLLAMKQKELGGRARAPQPLKVAG
jgi:hypothetical protein